MCYNETRYKKYKNNHRGRSGRQDISRHPVGSHLGESGRRNRLRRVEAFGETFESWQPICVEKQLEGLCPGQVLSLFHGPVCRDTDTGATPYINAGYAALKEKKYMSMTVNGMFWKPSTRRDYDDQKGT